LDELIYSRKYGVHVVAILKTSIKHKTFSFNYLSFIYPFRKSCWPKPNFSFSTSQKKYLALFFFQSFFSFII
jgi:hypothetical protein